MTPLRLDLGLVASLAAATWLGAASAHATPVITTYAQSSIGPATDSDGPQTGGALSSSVTTSGAVSRCSITGTCAPGAVTQGNALAAQSETVFGIFSALQADGSFFVGGQSASNSLLARTTWEESPPVAGPTSITLFIKAGELTIFDFASIVFSHNSSARYRIELSVNGSVMFFSEATLSGGAGGLTLIESGTDLGGTLFVDVDYPDSIRGYTFAPLFTTLNLGNLTTSDVVRYTMEVSVTGPGLETGGFARVGDPFDLSGNGSGIAFSVPEPSVALMLSVAGAIALAIWRKRNRPPSQRQ